jgi:hypothetical protein
MQFIRRAGRGAVAAAMLLSFCAAARAEGVLDQVPSDAWVVFRVNRLEQTNKKAAAWAEAMGLAQLSPEAADPLGALERHLNLQGVDRTKDLAVVFLDPSTTGGDPEKSMLVLVPTTDYKALVNSLPGAKTDAGVSTFTPEGQEEPSYVANWGAYAAMTPAQTVLSKKPGGLKLSGLAAKEMQEKDAVVYANIPAMRAKLLPQLQKMRADVKKQMQAQTGGAAGKTAPAATTPGNRPAARPGAVQPGNRPQPGPRPQPTRPGQRPQGRADDAAADVELAAFQQQPSRQPTRRPAPTPPPARRPAAPPDADAAEDADPDTNDTPGAEDPAAAMMKQYGPALGALADQYFNAAERFLTDANSATFSLNLTDAGLNTTLAAEFTQGSYLGKIAAGMKNSDGNLLTGLPGERKYFAFGGFNNSPEQLNQLVTDFVDPVLKQLGNTGQGGQNVTQLVDAVKKVVQNTKTMAIGYPAPTGALGTESIIQAVGVSTGNAKAIAESQKTILKGMNSIMQQMPKAAAGNAAAAGPGEMTMEFQEGAKAVGNVKLDQYKFNMQMDPDSPQAAQAQQMIGMIYGPNGMSGVLGAVNDTTFISVQGGTDQLVQAAVQAAQNPQDKLSALGPVKAAGGQLPQNRFGVFYLQLDQIISSGVRYAQGFGVPVKMQLPPNLPPIGFTAASEGPAVRFDTHVPTTTIQSIVAAGMQAYMQMQGGGGAQGAPEGL